MQKRLEAWIEANSGLRDVYVGLCDIHGIWRGKRIPAKKLSKLDASPIRIPVSAAAVDIWGNDVLANPLFSQSGDKDGLCLPTGRLPLVIPGDRSTASALLPIWLTDESGEPHEVDPRGALARASRRFGAAGLRPVIGTELEFYLLKPGAPTLEPAISPHGNRPFAGGGVLSVDELQSVEPFLDEVYRIAEGHEILPEASIAEGGPGQFEIAILHCDDALEAADNFILLKYILRHVARKHGFEACFMAKPFPEMAGCGFHVHLSLLDESGVNIFATGTFAENAPLRHAVGGVLDALPQSTLIFAPHLNSFRRFSENSLAPTTISWGAENRTCAVRIPDGSASARRIEHRVAGVDANPYLVLTAILNAALDGIENKADPGAPFENDAYKSDGKRIPCTWWDALKAFEEGEVSHGLFPALLSQSIALCKHQELGVFSARMTDFEVETYRSTV